MPRILNINGKPYTSAQEEVALQQLKHHALKCLQENIANAMRTARGGQLQLDPSPLLESIEQAYYLGKENALLKKGSES